MKDLRPHQTAAHDGLRSGFRAGKRRGLLVMPTGAGKTVTALEMLRLAATQGRRGLFLCDRRSLVLQAARECREYGVDCGVVMSGASEFRRPSAPVQFASKDTLLSWSQRPDWELPAADLVITDEAHRSAAETWTSLLAAYPRAWEVGLTATPARGDSRGLGTRYEFLVQPTTYSALISSGVLTPALCYAPGKKVSAKSRRPTRTSMVGDVVGWWQRLAPGRRTFVFASSVAHSLALRDEFRAANVPAEHLDGNTSDAERDAVLGRDGRLARGDVMVVCSCSVLKYGVDCPGVDCIQLADGFGSLVDYLQAVGRGLRAAQGKSDCIVIDHAGAVLYHGFPDADRDWMLSHTTDHADDYRSRMASGKAPRPIVCPKCSAIFTGRPDCPHCGHKLSQKQARAVGQAPGTLHQVERGGSYQFDAEDLRRGWASAVAVAHHTGRSLAAAAQVFKGQFRQLPWEARVGPLPPAGYNWHTPATLWWQRAFTKSPEPNEAIL